MSARNYLAAQDSREAFAAIDEEAYNWQDEQSLARLAYDAGHSMAYDAAEDDSDDEEDIIFQW